MNSTRQTRLELLTGRSDFWISAISIVNAVLANYLQNELAIINEVIPLS